MGAKIGENAENLGGTRLMGAALAIENVERDLREILPRVLSAEPSKVVAFKGRATQRTADNWREGLNLPQVPHFIMLAKQYPELRRLVLDWLDAETGDSGEDISELATRLQRAIAERMK